MKSILVLLTAFFFLQSNGQQSLQLPDSIQKQFQILVKNQNILIDVVKKGGSNIKTGGTLMIVGALITTAGAAAMAFGRPQTKNKISANGQLVGSNDLTLSPIQIAGICLTPIGIVSTLFGYIKISEGGKRLHDL